MKKNTLSPILLALVLGIITHMHGMNLKSKFPRTTPRIVLQRAPQRQEYPTTPYQSPNWADKFKQLSYRFKTLLFGPSKTDVQILDEINPLVEKIKNKEPQFIQSLDEFLENNPQKEIDILLSKLAFSENELDTINARVFGLQLGLAIGVRNKPMIQKYIEWAKNNIIQLFTLNLPIDENFFLLPLLELDNKQELIKRIAANLAYIQQRTAGKKFLALLRKANPRAYSQITAVAAIKNEISTSNKIITTKE